MTIYISKRLQLQVTEALAQAGTPMTTNDIAKLVGKSPQATRAALQASGALKLDESWPVLWASNRNTAGKVPSQFNDVQLTVGAKDVDGILTMWNENHEILGDSIKKLHINPDSTVSAVATQLGTIAGSIAYLAHQLDNVAGKPDWYEILTESE